MSFTTFYRGTILIGLLLSLFILFGEKIFEFSYKRSTRLLVVVATVIVGITLLRSSLRVKEVKDDRPASEAISLLFEGQSLKGATRIIKFYKVDELFLGKTYLDMLLLPVPRAIYKNKPEWYGIDDISRKMGLPSTSQSSVSIFGEAFANFIFLGFITIPFWGLLFYFFSKIDLAGFIVFVVPMIMSIFWMSFTGFMNSIVYLLLYIIIIQFCKKKRVNT